MSRVRRTRARPGAGDEFEVDARDRILGDDGVTECSPPQNVRSTDGHGAQFALTSLVQLNVAGVQKFAALRYQTE